VTYFKLCAKIRISEQKAKTFLSFFERGYYKQLATWLQKNNIHCLLQPGCSNVFLPLQMKIEKTIKICHTNIITITTTSMTMTITVTIIITSCPPP